MIEYEKRRLAEKMKKAIVKGITDFIKYNQNLYHLNLSNTGLNDDLIKKIGVALRKARALVCIHLTGNPGISEYNVNFLHKRIRCQEPMGKYIAMDFEGDKEEHHGLTA